MSNYKRVMVLCSMLVSALFADTWDFSFFKNTNTTLTTTETVTVEDLLAEYKAIKEQFKTEFELTDIEAKKVVHRLKKLFLKDKNSFYAVDIFIADTIPGMDIESIHVPSYSVSLDKIEGAYQTTYTYNGEIISSDEGRLVMALDKQRHEELRDQYNWAREQNIESITAVLKTVLNSKTFFLLEPKFQEAARGSAPYITLSLDAKALKKLLKKAEKAMIAVDVHTQFDISGANQEPNPSDTNSDIIEWRARFKSYLEKTYVDQRHKEDSNSWMGNSIGIYYSDAECPSVAEVTNPDGIYTGYTPAQEDSYQIKYYLNDPNNNGNVIDQLDENSTDYIYEKKVYDLKSHTKVITGILSTVAPMSHLFCKGAHLTHYKTATYTPDYTDENTTVYEHVLPTESEMAAIQIESYSLNRENSSSESDSSRNYTPMDMVFDNHAFDNNVPIFISAGNMGTYANDWYYAPYYDADVVSPAKAFNVITVGNYGFNDGNQSVLKTSSSIHNPILDYNTSKNYQKPEISAPGTGFYRLEHNGTDLVDDFDYSGTSFATPFAAAMAATQMSWRHSQCDNCAEYVQGTLYKAMILATAIESVGVEDLQGFDTRYHVGEGGVSNAPEIVKSIYNQQDNRSLFFTEEVNGTMCHTQWQAILKGPAHYRTVLTWFNRLSTYDIDNIPNSFTLEMLKPDGTVIGGKADRPYQGYQVVNFTIGNDVEGTYTARICETDVKDNNNVKLGLAISKVPFTPPPPGVIEAINTLLLLD